MGHIKKEDLQPVLNNLGYECEDHLGRGSYGQVYRVSQGTGPDPQKFALKFLDTSKRNEHDPQKYNKRELDLLQNISKQNVVEYHENWNMTVCGIEILCIKMELCWCTLEGFIYNNDMGGAEIIKARDQPRLYQQVFPQILKGLQAIHSIGWVHRDIHYQNILVAMPEPTKISEIKIKIADFGLAREIESTSQKQTLTPYPNGGLLAAPELATECYDKKVDLYSAGIVLYFLSRYLEDPVQWRGEIEKLKNDAPFYDHLYFKDDDVLIIMIMSLTAKEPKERPTAEEALQKMKESLNAHLPVTETYPSEGKTILVKNKGDRWWKRINIVDFTLSSLKDQILSCTGLKLKNATLIQITDMHFTGSDAPQQVEVEIDNDAQVKKMFLSAKTPGKEKAIRIVVHEVHEKMDTSN
jgi:serine/threonine protein kinase